MTLLVALLSAAIAARGAVVQEALSRNAAVSEDWETPPELAARDVVPDELFRGKHHEVRPEVINDGYLNYYRIDTDFGEMEAYGTFDLRVRVQEIEALAKLQELSKLDVFLQAPVDEAKQPFALLADLFGHPVATLKGVPTGVERVFTRPIYRVGEAWDEVQEFREKEAARAARKRQH